LAIIAESVVNPSRSVASPNYDSDHRNDTAKPSKSRQQLQQDGHGGSPHAGRPRFPARRWPWWTASFHARLGGADSIFLNTGRCTTNPDFLRLPTRLRECPGPKLWVGCLLLVSGSVVTYGEAEGLFVLMVKNVLFSTHSREG